MLPLSCVPSERARAIKGVLFDLDDTVLTQGVLTRIAFDALWALHDAGLRLVVVTGRPSSWGEMLARQWPIDGAVTENGAVHVVREGRSILIRERCTADERKKRRMRLEELIARVAAVVPEATLTDDIAGRRSDVTWDIGERAHPPRECVDRIAEVVHCSGARATRSSVHLHATFDVDDKASGAISFLTRVLGEDAGSAILDYAFVGDSGNDAACFAGFALTFGVANVRSSLRRIVVPPRYVAVRAMGEGFAEVADRLLSLRGAPCSTGAPKIAELEVRPDRV